MNCKKLLPSDPCIWHENEELINVGLGQTYCEQISHVLATHTGPMAAASRSASEIFPDKVLRIHEPPFILFFACLAVANEQPQFAIKTQVQPLLKTSLTSSTEVRRNFRRGQNFEREFDRKFHFPTQSCLKTTSS